MSSEIPAEARALLTQRLGSTWTAEALFGDASVRQYFRVAAAEGSFILAWYPDAVRGDVKRVVDSWKSVHESCRVPAVIDSIEAAILLEDVGDETLFEILHRDRAKGIEFYHRAIDLLIDYQKSPPQARSINPPFDAQKFEAELEMTSQYWVQEFFELSSTRLDELRRELRTLCESISAHPYVLCHRDYHGQNIHWFREELYMIDYQDQRLGPDTYDLASLLRDRGVAEILGDEHEEELVESYRRKLGAGRDLRARYFETLLQRTIKIIGTFAKQAVTRGRLHYLDFIPPALASVQRSLRELPRYEAIGRLFPPEMPARK